VAPPLVDLLVARSVPSGPVRHEVRDLGAGFWAAAEAGEPTAAIAGPWVGAGIIAAGRVVA
jgi:hypothetical protein